MEYKQSKFSDETISPFNKLSQALHAVHDRLISERYTIIGGKYAPPKEKQG